jgi:hypothetical protein
LDRRSAKEEEKMHPYLDACAGLLEKDWRNLMETRHPNNVHNFPEEIINKMFFRENHERIPELKRQNSGHATSQTKL